MIEIAPESVIKEKITLRDWVWIAVLILPSLYILLTLPPLWRDTDGFNEIASTFAPKGIIHWLPGYCLVGRLLMIGAGVLGSLLTGHGLPYLSLGTPELSDIGIYSLLVIQHLLLVYGLFFVVRTMANRFFLRLLFAISFALTPWLYLFAQCVGTEAFSNPLVCLIAAYGWICLRTYRLQFQQLAGLFLLLLAAALTRHINLVLVALLPLAFSASAIAQQFLPRSNSSRIKATNGFQVWKKLTAYGLIGVAVALASVGVQQAMCWMFRVPYRSTFGVTFEWRLDYLDKLPVAERNAILEKVEAKVNDPVVNEAIQDLIQAMDRKEERHYGYLYERIDQILSRIERKGLQQHLFEIDSKLNRVARAFLTPPDPALLDAVKREMLRIPALTQANMAAQPLALTDSLQRELTAPRYARLRSLRSFQFPSDHYKQLFQTNAYFRLFNTIPLGSLILLSFAGGLIVLLGDPSSLISLDGVCYSWSMVAAGFLMALGNCFSTSFGERYFLPLYSLVQISLMLLSSLLVERLLVAKPDPSAG